MASKLARSFFAALLPGLSALASAGTTPIDPFTTPGVAGTGGTGFVDGPCYCQQTALFSPVLMLQTGTYDFGEIRDYWVVADATPDGGPDQPVIYLLFSPLVTTGNYPYEFAAQPDYEFPTLALCDQNDAACNATYSGAYEDIPLVYSVGTDEDAIQIGLVGHYQYTSPLPEPFEGATLAAGLALLAGIGARRVRR
jgi:hypothetical protein